MLCFNEHNKSGIIIPAEQRFTDINRKYILPPNKPGYVFYMEDFFAHDLYPELCQVHWEFKKRDVL